DEFKERELLPEAVLNELEEGGMSKGVLQATKADDSVVGMYAVEAEDGETARAAAKEYVSAQRGGDLPIVRDFSMQGVPVLGTDTGDEPVYRAVYVSYTRLIIIDVYGENGADVTKLFTNLLDKQVAHTPPTVREPF